MANDLGPDGFSSLFRWKIYVSVLEGDVLIFSKPTSNEDKPIRTFLDASFVEYLIKRDRKSALAIMAVSTAVRANALSLLASLVKSNLGNKETVHWFRNTFSPSSRKAIECVIIRYDALPHFSTPTIKLGWAALKAVIVIELPSSDTYRLIEKGYKNNVGATAWVKDNWAVVLGGKTYSPDDGAVARSASSPVIEAILALRDRSFDLFRAVYVNESTEAVAKLAKAPAVAEENVVVESVEFVSPGLPGERRADKRQEYFEMKRTGYGSVPEEAMTKLQSWTRPEGHVLG